MEPEVAGSSPSLPLADPAAARMRAAMGRTARQARGVSAAQRDTLPPIQRVPLSQLQRATGLSLRYVSLIRRGERTPHPRHWQALIGAGPRSERNLSRSRKLFRASMSDEG